MARRGSSGSRRSTTRHAELGAEFFTGAGWERPQWFEANAALVPTARRGPPHGWAARNWSPIVGAEHIATRERAALFDITPFAKFDVEGPDALAFLERICANRIDRPVGTIVYTAMLTPARRDPLRPHGHPQGGGAVPRGDRRRERAARPGVAARQLRDGERVDITERTGSLFALGLWGPSARDILQAVTDADARTRRSRT